MPTYQILVQHTFTASHALQFPDGTWEPVHKHQWRIEVVVSAEVLDALGTVMDFHILQADLQALTAPWQGQNLNQCAPFGPHAIPSAERVVAALAQGLQPRLPETVRLVSVTTTEAPGCRARYLT
jgi:6-pyruvoyltetrahydropterin/6-carboxytetrahydropterin synthase